MGNFFSLSTSKNKNRNINSSSNNITNSYTAPKIASYLFSKAPLFSNLFGADQKYNIFFIYNVNNEDLDENNFAQTFIHKILSQDTKKLDEKIQELQKLKSNIEGVPFKEIKKEYPTWDAYIIIKNNIKRYNQEIQNVINKLQSQKNKNKKNALAKNEKSAANSVGSNLPNGSEGTSPRRSNLNNPATSVGSNLPIGSEGTSQEKSKINNPTNSVGSKLPIKYNKIDTPTDIFNKYKDIDSILDLLSRKINTELRKKLKSNSSKKLYEIAPNDVKVFIKLLLIFRTLLDPKTLSENYERLLIFIDKNKKIVKIIDPNDETVSKISPNERIIITNSDQDIIKKYNEFIFENKTDNIEIKNLIKSFKIELIEKNHEELKIEFNTIISKLLVDYPLLSPKKNLSSKKEFKIYENNKKIIIPQNMRNKFNINS